MSATRTLPFLAELNRVMNDTNARKQVAIKIMNKDWMTDGWGFKKISKEKRTLVSGFTTSGCQSHISCVFGEFRNTYDSKGATANGSLADTVNKLEYRKYGYNAGCVRPKTGIEILAAQPNATGHTYSRQCRITIKELKDACKMNGIKTTGLDKKGLLAALMKI